MTEPRSEESPGQGIPPLVTIYCYLTEGCNLACRHCWLAPGYDPDGSRHAVLPVETFRNVLAEAKPLGLTTVKLTGGEPLLHPRFAELVAVARHAEVAVHVETNGLLCTPETAALIASAPRPFVSVSIDGADAATHDWIRGVPGAFARACAAVENLAGAGLKPQVVMSILSRNSGQLEAVVRMAGKLGAASVKFNLVQPTARGAGIHESGQSPGVKELIALGQWVDGEMSKRTPLDLHFDIPAAFRPLSRLARGDEQCGILTVLGLLSSGHYALCGIGMHAKELVFGKAREDTLARVWRSHPVLREIRQGMARRLSGVCGRCVVKELCRGACMAQNYYGSGSVWGPYWFCRDAERAGLFPVGRLAGLNDRPDGRKDQEAKA